MHRLVPTSLIALALCLPPTAQAHKRWLIPSHTVVSGQQWVTVDASVSNDLFHVDRPLRLEGLRVLAPDGSPAPVDNRLEGRRRSVFDLKLRREGTYRISLGGRFYAARYDTPAGERKMLRGDAAKLADLPADAVNLHITESIGRLETFVTAGAPSRDNLAPSGAGLELVADTHPNDVYAGEAATFGFLIDGRPAAGLTVSVIPGGTRYRDTQAELTLVTDTEGRITITWPGPGLYFLEAETEDDKVSHPRAEKRRLQYLATFEVLPL